jgi:hypothetical protein
MKMRRVGVLLWLATLLACGPTTKRVATPASTPAIRPAATSRATSAPPMRQVQLKLADGTPLADHVLKLKCGVDHAVQARTDAMGRARLLDDNCRLWLGDRYLALPKGQQTMVLPADLRVEVDVGMPIQATLTLDSRVDGVHPLRRSMLALSLRDGIVTNWGRRLVAATAGARVGPSRGVKKAYLETRQATLQLFWDFNRRYSPKQPLANRKAVMAALMAGEKAVTAGQHAKAKASCARALKLTAKRPLTSWLRASALACETSRQVGEFLRKDCFPVRRLPLKALARFEQRLGARAVALKKQASSLFKARNAWISLTMMVEFASIYSGFAYAVHQGYNDTPVPRQVTQLGRPGIKRYQRAMGELRATKLSPLLTEGMKLLRTAERKIERLFGPPVAKRLLKQLAAQKRAQIALGTSLSASAVLRIRSVRRVGLVPAALRGTPRGREALALPLRTSTGLRPLSALLGKRRTLLVISRCHHERGWMAVLGQLAEGYRRIGLKVAAVAVRRCPSVVAERGFWRAGPLLPWALEAPPDSVVVLDASGAVLWRQRLRAIGDAALTATAWLEANWPAFAQAKRRGAPLPQAALARKLAKLGGAVEAALKRGKTSRALKLARRAVKLAPQSAKVQRQLALAAGHARDLGTVTDRARWWRQRFGDLAAELLLDGVRRETGVPKLPDPGQYTPSTGPSAPPRAPSLPAGANR